MSTLVLSGNLKTFTSLHVGAKPGDSEVDARLRRNASGDVFIPGSAIAGSLRALATRLAPRLEEAGGRVCKAIVPKADTSKPCDCLVCQVFGEFYPQSANAGTDGGRAARLWVHDAKLLTPQVTAVRDGVGIDRSTGAAARREQVKFDLEVLPAGAEFELRLELEDAQPEHERLLAAVLAEWQAGRGTVGGRVARGLGGFSLEELNCLKRELNEPEGLMAFLRGDLDQPGEIAVPWPGNRLKDVGIVAVEGLDDEAAQDWVARGWVEVEVTLQADGPFLVNDAVQSLKAGFDHAPLVEGLPVLPGSSLRGVLRSHAERIARTLATRNAKGSKGDFLRRCPACNPLARPRGEAEPDETKNRPRPPALQSCDSLLDKIKIQGQKEIEAGDLCLACQLFGSTRFGSRLIVQDAPLVGEPKYKVQDFLAIDRFTGGGRDSAKFDALALWKPAFAARLRLENPRPWELGWLALVLRDLAEGWLTAGFGRAKGFGQVKVSEWRVRAGFLDESDLKGLTDKAPTYEATRNDSVFQVFEVKPGDALAWRDQVGEWVEAFKNKVCEFDREKIELPVLLEDGYFSRELDRLYPWEVKLDG